MDCLLRTYLRTYGDLHLLNKSKCAYHYERIFTLDRAWLPVETKSRNFKNKSYTLTFLLSTKIRVSVAEGASRAANECVTRGTRYGSARDVEWARAILHPVD